MNDRLLVGTRKGLFELRRARGEPCTWRVVDYRYALPR
jgi:hypothetical protein